MKNLFKYISVLLTFLTFSCTDIIDLQSESNISDANFMLIIQTFK